MPQKKSQITVFMMITVIIVALGIFGYYMLSYDAEKTTEDRKIPTTVEEIKTYIETCLETSSTKAIRQLALNGGTLEIVEEKEYHFDLYTYLARYHENKGIVSTLVTRESMERELSKYIEDDMLNCDLEKFNAIGFEIVAEEDEIKVDSTVGIDDVSFTLIYPVKARKGDDKKEFTEFSYQSHLKLGKAFDLAMHIIKKEITEERFDEDDWMRTYAEIKIEKHKPYPDIVYRLETDGGTPHELDFYFAIQGQDKSSNIISYLQKPIINGVCRLSDNNCYFNIKQSDCNAIFGDWSDDYLNCVGLSEYETEGSKKDCGAYKHGESFCILDGISGPGFDPPGSRHYKISCFDGRLYGTECADYREELCSEPEKGNAFCRKNRWMDCAIQTSEAACTNEELRDCYWQEGLEKADPYRNNEVKYDYSNRKCFPWVPPGFRTWEGAGEQVCSLASEQNNCKNVHCPWTWIESTAVYCYFMGDCGNYFNYLREPKYNTFGGFETTDTSPREYIYQIPWEHTEEYKIGLSLKTDYNVNGNEFNFKEGEMSYLMGQMSAYEQRMYNTPRIKHNVDPPDVQVDIDTTHTSVCHPWISPEDNSRCGECNGDFSRPCSEYRCKSISVNCEYSEVNGIGRCSDQNIVPSESINTIIRNGYILNPDAEIDDILEGINYAQGRVNIQSTILDDMFGWTFDTAEDQRVVLWLESDQEIKARVTRSSHGHSGRMNIYSTAYSQKIPIIVNTESYDTEFQSYITVEDEDPVTYTGIDGEEVWSTSASNVADEFDPSSLYSIVDDTTTHIQHLNANFGIMQGTLTGQQTGVMDAGMDRVAFDTGFDFSGFGNVLGGLLGMFDMRKVFVQDYLEDNRESLLNCQVGKIYHIVEVSNARGEKDYFFVTYAIPPELS